MDSDYLTFYCKELNKKILIVKLPCGSTKKFVFNQKTMSFDSINCSDCIPPQMDCDLTPRHTDWCPHTHNTIVFAYNHVLKMNLKYRFDCETGSFQEIECPDCHLNPDKTTDPKQIVMVATSPKSNRAIVLTMNKKGRVQKMQYDDKTKKYVDMDPTTVNALATRTVLELKKEEEELPILMTNISFSPREPQSENDLIPLYLEKSKKLPKTDILVAKNMTTGKLGMYVFDRYFHQFIQVFLPDVSLEKERTIQPGQRLLFLTMSLKDNQAISIQQNHEGGIRKLQYNRKAALFDLMQEKSIVEDEETLSEMIEKCSDERIALDLLSRLREFVVIQKDGRDLRDGIPSSSSTDDTDQEATYDTDSSSSDDDDNDSFEKISADEVAEC